MALQAGVSGGAVEQRHRLLAAELEGASEVDRSLHVLVAVEMAKAAVGPGGGETDVMVDRGVEVGHGAGEIALLAPHHAHAVRSEVCRLGKECVRRFRYWLEPDT